LHKPPGDKIKKKIEAAALLLKSLYNFVPKIAQSGAGDKTLFPTVFVAVL
jgi:hypothetical protein